MSDEQHETGRREKQLAVEFAREYVALKGNSIRTYMKVFEVSRQYAYRMIDAWMERPEVRQAIERYTSSDESGAIASPGEVMRTLTDILRGRKDKEGNSIGSDKERLKAAELMLKMRGQLDPKPKKQEANPFALPAGAYAEAKALPPGDLEDAIRGGANGEMRVEVTVKDVDEETDE